MTVSYAHAQPEGDEVAARSVRYHSEWLGARRLHLSDGPIDLVIGAEGDEASLRRAFAAAAHRFSTILDELVSELRLLRRPIGGDEECVRGAVARRMLAAARPHESRLVTPMISVAGAVADEVADEMMSAADLDRLYVNNGGDIALRITDDDTFNIASAASPTIRHAVLGPRIVLTKADRIGGIATSGLGGRSLTLGIADAVTVLASTAADADAAATLIANAVDIEDDRIRRRAASELDPDSDLGERLVTVERGSLPAESIALALENGCSTTSEMISTGRIRSAMLQCEGQIRIVGETDLIDA